MVWYMYYNSTNLVQRYVYWINIETGPANLRLVEYAALKEKFFLSTKGSLKYNCLIFKWT